MTAGPITCEQVAGLARIYCIPVQAFTGLKANIHLVIAGDYVALIDCGSSLGECDRQLEAGLAALRDEWGERVRWADIDRIIITHGHIDHYGGLNYVRQHSAAPIAVHELDRRVLVHHEERLALMSQTVAAFLRRAGLDDERRADMTKMYAWSKGLFRSVEVATVLRDGDTLDGLFQVYHTPGHCPGQICLQLGDVLFSADHVLAHTSPHMAPESLSAWTGLGHYLQSLRNTAALPGIRLALGGHEPPITELQKRIGRIERSHQRTLNRVLDLCSEPYTTAELAGLLYPHLEGYDVLLGLEEVAAHVEYLDQRGELAIANLDQVAADETAAPRYRRA